MKPRAGLLLPRTLRLRRAGGQLCGAAEACTHVEESTGANDIPAQPKTDRLALRRAVDKLGWKWVTRHTVAIRLEREFLFGPRKVQLRGRVTVPMPADMTNAAGEAALAQLAEPRINAFRVSVQRTIARTLSEPDDVSAEHVYERSDFFEALHDAEHGLAQTYQALADRRLDDRVEAELGLTFYLEALRTETRTFEYFVGPTNSGKTHAAIEMLRASKTGVYLAPLRLLALEIYERLNDLGVATSLVTGEERMLHPYARHVSSTVEMIDLHAPLDLAVVDEAQMLEDPQRGWAWTQAIAGVNARHVVLCGSVEGLRAAQRLTKHLGVTLTIRKFQRKNALRVVPAIKLGALQPGDAVVAFSRKAVVELQVDIATRGFTSAAIYGALSPLVRRREADRFRTGAADILVATDAIGLGLNLPIRRVVFSAVDKWDGTEMRELATSEIRQLAGRAGRYGMHEEGLVTAFHEKDVQLLEASIAAPPVNADERPIWIAPTDEHLRRLSAIIATKRVSRLLRFFQTRVLQRSDEGMRIADLTDQIEVAGALESSDAFLRLPLDVRCAYGRAPVNTRGPGLAILARWGETHASGGSVLGTEIQSASGARDRLLGFEDKSRLATLYLWLAQRFPNTYINHDAVVRARDTIDADIAAALLKNGAKSKKRNGAHPVRRMADGRIPQRAFEKKPAFNKKKLPKTKR